MSDRVDLVELKARYCRFVDTKQWDELRGLLADDIAVFADPGPLPEATEPRLRGADTFIGWASRALAGLTTVHHVMSPEIDVAGDRASARWAMQDWLVDPVRGVGRYGVGHYHDEYVRTDDGVWRQTVLRLTRLYVGRRDPADLGGVDITGPASRTGN